jgi:glycosyltransferase involved in cell wall biosynthesis
MAIDGVSRQLVEDASAGTYVEPENAAEYSRIIRQYLAQPHRVATEGESGYQYARNNFDREVLAARYLAHIATLIKK